MKRLTGIDPDRLPEEKERGMTIDLGFAHWMGPSGELADTPVAAFVDVPGHERFVRNMIAGVGAIEAVILVVAADDGWMPQTQEHLDIVRLLGVRKGIVALTKSDAVESAWLDAVGADIHIRLTGTFLEHAPILAVSSQTGAGYAELEDALANLARAHVTDQDVGKGRLWIDRAFTLAGIGGVISGTTRNGGFGVGEEIVLYPAEVHGKIRTLHRHNRAVERIGEGERAAMSFTGVGKGGLARGQVVAHPSAAREMGRARRLLCRLEVLPSFPFAVKNRRKALLFHGTAEIPCEIRLLEAEPLKPGEIRLVMIACDWEPLCYVADAFIVRLPTPPVTLGGGVILGWCESTPTERYVSELRKLLATDRVTARDAALWELTRDIVAAKNEILMRSAHSPSEIQRALRTLGDEGLIGEDDNSVWAVGPMNALLAELGGNIEVRLRAEPHLRGVTSEEAHRILAAKGVSSGAGDTVLSLGERMGVLSRSDGRYAPAVRAVELTGELKREVDRVWEAISRDSLAPPLLPELISKGKLSRDAIGFLLESGRAIKMGAEVVYIRNSWGAAVSVVGRLTSAGEGVTVSAFRSTLGVSRKYAVPLLEEMDRRRITVREGDLRKRGPSFDAALKEFGA